MLLAVLRYACRLLPDMPDRKSVEILPALFAVPSFAFINKSIIAYKEAL
jgi:hypothetical protein